jgi:hypothetical protein
VAVFLSVLYQDYRGFDADQTVKNHTLIRVKYPHL